MSSPFDKRYFSCSVSNIMQFKLETETSGAISHSTGIVLLREIIGRSQFQMTPEIFV